RFPRPSRRVSHAAQRNRPRECDVGRRTGAGLRRGIMKRMNGSEFFGAAATELAPGARNAIDVCLGIRAGERVALIADEASGAVAASLAAVLDEVDAPWEGVLIERVASRPLSTAPSEVLSVLEEADARTLCVHPRQGELGARMAIVSVVERRQIRYAHMVGVTALILQQGMRADSRLVDELSRRLCERMPRATRLRVETPGGTAFTATFDPS